MDADDVGFVAKRRLPPDKAGELRLLQSGKDGGKPRRRLGMAVTWIVTGTVRMGHKQCRHGVNLKKAQRQ